MKRLLVILAVLILLPIHGSWGQEDDSELSIVFMGSRAGIDNLSDWNGGFSFGTQFPFPGLEAKGIHTRLVYSQFNINPDAPMRTIEPAALIDFYVGKKWHIWWTAIGAEAYTDGPNHGMKLFTGVGVGRRVWTIGENDNRVGFDVFLETNFVNADGENTGNYADLSLGLKLSRL
jgi:hypothetical protein